MKKILVLIACVTLIILVNVKPVSAGGGFPICYPNCEEETPRQTSQDSENIIPQLAPEVSPTATAGEGNMLESTSTDTQEIQCVELGWWRLLYALQFIIHSFFYWLSLRPGSKRTYYILQVSIGSIFLFIFVKYFCPVWDFVPSVAMSLTTNYFVLKRRIQPR